MQNRGQLKLENTNTNARLVAPPPSIPDRLQAKPATLVGKSIAINGQPFQIIGIFESIGGGFATRARTSPR